MVKVNPYDEQLKAQNNLKASLLMDKEYYTNQLNSLLKQLGYMFLEKKLDSIELMYIPSNWLRLYQPYQKRKNYINNLKDTIHWLSKTFQKLDQCEKEIIYLTRERDKLEYIKCEERGKRETRNKR